VRTEGFTGRAAVVLVDTSVWIEVFRKSSRLDFVSLVDFDDVVTCLPVLQEVLQGFSAEPAFTKARQAMLALPIVEAPLGGDVFLHAADLYRAARRTGLPVRSGADCVIAACAIRNHLEVLHLDRDFDVLAQVSPLQARNIA
jgi:predicted nucleic acid-binding protein